MKSKFRILVILLSFGVVMTACKTTSQSEKHYEKLEEKNAAAEQKEYDNRVKGHKEMQSKDTQKMLKKTEKESKRLNKSRKPKLKKC